MGIYNHTTDLRRIGVFKDADEVAGFLMTGSTKKDRRPLRLLAVVAFIFAAFLVIAAPLHFFNIQLSSPPAAACSCQCGCQFGGKCLCGPDCDCDCGCANTTSCKCH